MVGGVMRSRILRGRLRGMRLGKMLLWRLRESRRSRKGQSSSDEIGIEDVGSGRRFQLARRVGSLMVGSQRLRRMSRLMLHRHRQVWVLPLVIWIWLVWGWVLDL